MSHKIEEKLKSLCERILNEENGDISDATLDNIEALFEEALLAKALESHKSRLSQLTGRVGERLFGEVETSEPEQKPIANPKAETPSSEAVLRSDVKILPTPEGPPKPKPRPEYQSRMNESANPAPSAARVPASNASHNPVNIGLNDRVAFVKQLFQGSQEDFNRVISQINTLSNYEEALNFIEEFVKPEYDWSQAEDIEIRFLELIAIRYNRS